MSEKRRIKVLQVVDEESFIGRIGWAGQAGDRPKVGHATQS